MKKINSPPNPFTPSVLALILAAALAVCGSIRSGRADEKSDLNDRITALEQGQAENDRRTIENSNPVHAFLTDRLTFGGYFESAITQLTGPDTNFQIGAAQNTLGLNLAGEFNSALRFNSQVLNVLSALLLNPDNDPRATTLGLPVSRQYKGIFFGSVLTEAYLEYSTQESFQLQGGEGYAPFGIALQQRELVLFVRRGGPQLLRIPGLANSLWTGVHASGTFSLINARTGYDLYSCTSSGDLTLPCLGARGWWQSRDETVTAGASTQAGRANSQDYEVIGADVRIKAGRFSLDSEYAITIEAGDEPYTGYVEPHFAILSDSWLLYAFVDYSNDSQNMTSASATGLGPSIPDPYQRLEYGGGVNWLPTPYTRLRLGFYVFDYLGNTAVPGGPDRDLYATDLSAAVAF